MPRELSPTRRLLLNVRARGLALVHRTDRIIRFKGSGGDSANVRHYLSTWHLRHRVPYMGQLPHFDYLFVQNLLDEEFVAFSGPKLYCAKEPPILLTAETQAYIRRPDLRPHCYLFDEPDISQRMFYPTLDRDPQAHANGLEKTVTQRRPKRCCFINRWTNDFERNLIRERLRYVDSFGGDVDIYGGVPMSGENGWLAYPNYLGPAADKRQMIGRYDFIIAFENSDFDGYVTEKIIEALIMGTIPLYWGGGRYLAETIPDDCFINCRDQDPEAIHQRVMAMGFDEIVAYRRAGIRFLRTPAARRFTHAYWTEGILKRLQAQEA